MSEFHGCVKEDFVGVFIEAYARIFKRLEDLGANWIQLDEPSLVKDLDEKELALFKALYEPLLLQKASSRFWHRHISVTFAMLMTFC